MKKENIRGIAAAAIVVVVYLLLALVIPFEKNATYWVSFVFTLLSFGVVAGAFYIAFFRKPEAKSQFYGFPIARIGFIYGVAQLIAGFVFMIVGRWVPAWIPTLLYAVAMGAALLGLISAEAVVDQIEVMDQKLKTDVSFMRGLQSKANQLPGLTTDPEMVKQLQKFAEDVRFSDPVSAASLGEAERDLGMGVDELQQALVDGDSAAARQLLPKCTVLLAERNRLCKLSKADK